MGLEPWDTELDLAFVDWPMSVILFLDFDGVLHSDNMNSPQFEFLPIFEAFLRDNPNVGIVVSSSWRMDRPMAAIRSVFSSDVRHRVLAATPILPDGFADGGRWGEIILFMGENGLDGVPFVALDDDRRLFPEGCESLYLVDPTGFTEIDARRLSAMISAVSEG